MAANWTSMIAAERMALDQEFSDQIQASSFDRQQWGLVMTALEFDIENPSNPDEAALVPDASSVPAILPELDRISQQGPMGAGNQSARGGGGLVDSVKGALGLDSSDTDEQLEEATELASDYCERLQEMLESKGRWESICQSVREE